MNHQRLHDLLNLILGWLNMPKFQPYHDKPLDGDPKGCRKACALIFHDCCNQIWKEFSKHEVSYRMNLSDKPCILRRPIFAETGTWSGLITK
jgi:hypothetical protein